MQLVLALASKFMFTSRSSTTRLRRSTCSPMAASCPIIIGKLAGTMHSARRLRKRTARCLLHIKTNIQKYAYYMHRMLDNNLIVLIIIRCQAASRRRKLSMPSASPRRASVFLKVVYSNSSIAAAATMAGEIYASATQSLAEEQWVIDDYRRSR